MVILFVVPVFWPFLLLYAVVKLWRITVPLAVVGILYLLVQTAPLVGYPALVLTVVIVVWQLHMGQPSPIQQEDREWTHSI